MEEAKITSVKKADQTETHVKDPKRVEAGKRLAAMSKQAKDKKAVERSLQKMADDEFQIPSVNPLALVGVAGVVGVVVYYKYFYESKKSEDVGKVDQTQTSESPKQENLKRAERAEPTEGRHKRRELDTLD